MNAEEIRKATEDAQLTKDEFLNTLAEELYRIPFPTVGGEDAYPVKIERFGRGGIEIHLSDDSVFRLILKE
jgi:hypothetical protein